MPQLMEDGDFVSNVLSSLPGVNFKDPGVQGMVASLTGKSDEEEDKSKKDDKEEQR